MIRTAKNSGGQALVEVALVLPVLFFAGVVFFQVLTLCRNLIILQKSAADVAYSYALGTPGRLHRLAQQAAIYRSLRGRVTIPLVQHNTELMNPWPKSQGFATVTDHGSITSVDIKTALLPHAFMNWRLPFLRFDCAADMLKDPPIPEQE